MIALATFAKAGVSTAHNPCPYLPAFKTLQKRLPRMSSIDGLAALEKYRAEHENPAACEGIEIDRLKGLRESSFASLTDGITKRPAQAVFRCMQFDKATTRCDGPVLDTTAQPLSTGVRYTAVNFNADRPLTIRFDLPGARLIGVFQARLGDLTDGKAAVALNVAKNSFAPSEAASGSVIIALFETQGEWKYRKLVWYL